MMLNKGNIRRIFILFVSSMIMVFIYSGIFGKVYAGITMPVNKYRNIREQFELMSSNIVMAEEYIAERERIVAEVNYVYCKAYFYPEDTILFLNCLCEDNNVEIRRIKFSREEDDVDSSVLTAEAELFCTYECLLKFMDDIENDDSNAAISSINIMELENGKISAVLRLSLCSLN